MQTDLSGQMDVRMVNFRFEANLRRFFGVSEWNANVQPESSSSVRTLLGPIDDQFPMGEIFLDRAELGHFRVRFDLSKFFDQTFAIHFLAVDFHKNNNDGKTIAFIIVFFSVVTSFLSMVQ